MLVKYLRDDFGPYGCVVAIGPGVVGWSVCSSRDTFTKARAKQIAVGRAKASCKRLIHTKPPEYSLSELLKAFDEMSERSGRYFKTGVETASV